MNHAGDERVRSTDVAGNMSMTFAGRKGLIKAFVEHYNHQRYHESLVNVIPPAAFFGRASAIIKQRKRIKSSNAGSPPNIDPRTRQTLR